MYEPLNLARCIAFVWWVLLSLILTKRNLRIKSDKRIILIYFLFTVMIIGYVVSAIVNHQNFISAFLGHHNRNIGILFLVSILLMVLYITRVDFNVNAYINYGLLPTFVLTIFYGLLQVFGLDPFIWFENDRTTLTLGNSDFAAALIGSLASFPIFLFLKTNRVLAKVIISISAVILVYLGLYSQAFQFRVVAFIAVTVFLIIRFQELIARNIKSFLLFTFGFVSISIILTILNWNNLELLQRTNAVDRLDSTLTGLEVFREHLLFGVGVEQLWRFEPQYRGAQQAVRNGPNSVPDKVHNVFVDHLANGGIFVGISFIALIVLSMLLIFRMVNWKLDIIDRSFLALTSSIWVAYVLLLFITTDNVFAMVFAYSAFGLIIKFYLVYNKRVNV